MDSTKLSLRRKIKDPSQGRNVIRCLICLGTLTYLQETRLFFAISSEQVPARN